MIALSSVNEITGDIYLAIKFFTINTYTCLIKKFSKITQQGHLAVKALKSMICLPQGFRRPIWVKFRNISVESLKIMFGLNDGFLDSCLCYVVPQTVKNKNTASLIV